MPFKHINEGIEYLIDKHIVMPKECAEQEKQKKWDLWYLSLCDFIAQKSRDPSTKVAAYITETNNRPVSFGYNGFAQKCSDNPDYYNDREVKYLRILHSEINCIIFAKRDLTGCTIYTSPFRPCASCTSALIQAGITRFVTWDNDEDNPRWEKSFNEARRMCSEAGIVVDLYHKEGDDGKS